MYFYLPVELYFHILYSLSHSIHLFAFHWNLFRHLYPLSSLYFSLFLFKSNSICSLTNRPVSCIRIFISFICVCFLLEFIQAFVSSLLSLMYLFIIHYTFASEILSNSFSLEEINVQKSCCLDQSCFCVFVFRHQHLYSDHLIFFNPSCSLHGYICNIHRGLSSEL